jgi:hypothetical protein
MHCTQLGYMDVKYIYILLNGIKSTNLINSDFLP